jgi:diguanylate cyclase (GGDEF)-like protein
MEVGIETGNTEGGDPLPSLPPRALAQLLNALPTGVALHDSEGRIRWANEALAGQLGVAPHDLVGQTLEGLGLERKERGDGVPLFHVPRTAQGHAEWLRVSLVRLPQGEDSVLVAALAEDVTQTERLRLQIDRLQQALHGQVSTDETTGLLNRRGLMHQLESQVSRSRRYGNILSVVILRVRCPEAPGERPSPQRLVQAARVLRDQTRWPDIIGRWGEGDFALVLPETSGQAAASLVAKLLQHLEEVPAETDGGWVIAFGVAEWQRGDTAPALVERALRGLA